MDPRMWSFLTVEGERQYGGNEGYTDDPAARYCYDSDVANHLQVSKGDLVVVRSKTSVIGIGQVEDVVAGVGPKQRLRCPICGNTNIKRRATMTPPWRCKGNHDFPEPVVETVSVTTYEARYGNTFRPTGTLLSVDDVQQAVCRPSDQMSIKELDPAKLERKIDQSSPINSVFENIASILTEPSMPGGPADDGEGTSAIDSRRKVLREIALRRGQTSFRRRLMQRYGAVCQITGCAFPGLVEAAHLLPYATSGDNSVRNGLLLRTDLHTLFDLGLLGIHPAEMTVSLSSALDGTDYMRLVGRELKLNGSNGPSRAALEERWKFYQKKQELELQEFA